MEHVIAPDGSSAYKRYLAGGTVLITQDLDKDGRRTHEQTGYFDAWGQRRNPDDAGVLAQLTLTSPLHTRLTARGFTGHEMLDAAGIVHMNGRIYDPTLGRFLQPDPVIQFPDYTQGRNRYSYVLNNPLAYTDPTGYFIGKLFRKVIGGLINGILGEFLSIKVPVLRQFFTLGHCLSGNAVLCATATAGNAYAGGASLKRSFKAGLFAYVSAQAFTAVGDYFQAIEAVGGPAHWGAHALTGGVLTELQGGEFGHGFLSAAVAFGVGRIGEVKGWSVEAQFVASVVSAGTVSEVTGGKFANGATTAAFAFIYNELEHQAVQKSIEVTSRVNKDGKHYYQIRGMICRRDGVCSIEYADKVYGHVNRNDIPFTDDDLTVGPHNLPGGNPIRHEEFPGVRESINYTREGHFFHPGSVTHRVHFEDNVLYYDVIGEGAGRFPGINNRLGIRMFRPDVEDVVRQYGR